MEKINLNYLNTNDDESILKIKNNPLCEKIIEELNITNEEIITNYELLSNFSKYNKKCLTCKGMNECDHSTKGYIYNIKRGTNNYLTDCFTICKYYEDYYKRQSNLLLTTFNENDLLDESQKNFVMDNVSRLGLEFANKMIQILEGKKISGAYLSIADSKLRLKLVKSLASGLLLNNKVAIVKFSDFLQRIKSEFGSNNGPNALSLALESDILILDGLGSESITSWSRDEILFSILDSRLQSEKTTILCSEFPLEELRKIYKLNYNDGAKANQIVDKIIEIKE